MRRYQQGIFIFVEAEAHVTYSVAASVDMPVVFYKHVDVVKYHAVKVV